MYTEFAQIYDRLMKDVPYAEWARYYADLLEQYGISPGARCVECACGTGSLTIPLAQLGYRMTGMDLSPEMLNIAQQKARGSGVMIPFIRMDMRKLAVQRPVDAVLATCDGVNYLSKPEDVAAFFRAAHQALRPRGVLAFDVSTPYKLVEALGDRAFTLSEDDLVYIWQGQYSHKQKRFELHMDIFVGGPDRKYLRIQEDQCQRAHSQDELFDALTNTGFSNVHIFGDRVLTPPSQRELRWHVIAQKESE